MLVKNQFWMWLFVLVLTTLLYLLMTPQGAVLSVFRYVAAGIFFALYFFLPLIHRHVTLVGVLMAISLLAVAYPFQPPGIYIVLFSLTIFSGSMFYYTTKISSTVLHVLIFAALAAGAYLTGEHEPLMMIALTGALLLPVFHLLLAVHQQYEQLKKDHQFLFSDYKRLKRRLVNDEEMARREERQAIARDIHDSVGHKLTALLMQMEVFRMSVPEAEREKVQALKELAGEGLSETREAVRALKNQEEAGLSAILQLIRKLEAESMIHVQFTVRQGALTAPLTTDQAVAVYRSVQESLTNSMRHSEVKTVGITFEVAGGSVFQFSVTNPVKEDLTFSEGFGLKAMRERIERVEGTLTVQREGNEFIVQGRLPIQRGE
ncbi:Sensor histidine kinase yxjM [Salisediminibacterium beveridgei]|uniref:histidine kinase n=2 Tax=Salisediminibacterium beveridgei TaxID=632773 RepID=A0A1D7QTD2_9BACI|nr:Sensor histidine kinase yxjM [Salisediminibacterium beveridgei]